MNGTIDEHKKCYLLIINWFAIALGHADGEKNKELREEPFYQMARPHAHALVILSSLGITKRLSNIYEFKFICKREDVVRVATKNYSAGHSFSEILETFIELAVYYGSAEQRKNYPFSVHEDVEGIFIELELLGFAKRMGVDYQWTKKLDPVMKKINNYDFFDDKQVVVKRSERQGKPFRYLS